MPEYNTAQYHLHKLNLYVSIQTKYTFARTYASNMFTVSTFEWLPIGSLSIPGCKMKGNKKIKEKEKLLT